MYSDEYGTGPDDHGSPTSQRPRPGHSPGMATAALVFSILSLMSSMVIYAAVPLGAAAVLFALLSRGNRKMKGRGKAAIVLGIIGMVSSCILTAAAFHMVFTDTEMRSQFEYLFNLYAEQAGLDYEFDDFFSDGKFSFYPDENSQKDSETETEDPYAQFWADFYAGNSADSSDEDSVIPGEPVNPDVPSDPQEEQPGESLPAPVPDNTRPSSGGDFI